MEVAGLRSAATAIDGIAQAATVSGAVKHPADVGDDALASAVAAFASATQRSWSERLKATEKLADGLRTAATTYESADQDGREHVRAASRVF